MPGWVDPRWLWFLPNPRLPLPRHPDFCSSLDQGGLRAPGSSPGNRRPRILDGARPRRSSPRQTEASDVTNLLREQSNRSFALRGHAVLVRFEKTVKEVFVL
jgi:hypothetical protein